MTFPGVDLQLGLREAQWADLDRVLEIERESNPHHPWPSLWFEKELIRSYSRFLVAEREGQLLGYCVWWLAPYRAEILNISTDRIVRRSGIGTQLLQAALHSAKKLQLEKMDLEVRVDNESALSFYETHGFVRVGRRQGYYRDGTDAILMTLELV